MNALKSLISGSFTNWFNKTKTMKSKKDKALAKLFIIQILLFFGFLSHAQTDTITNGNSCTSYFSLKKLSILYHYIDSNQTHDYSGNWDFDGDGTKDNLYFIGTGGAHLYFYLRMVLSSDHKVRNFPFLELDRPCLGTIEDLGNLTLQSLKVDPQFVVDVFGDQRYSVSANPKIYLHLDQSASIPVELQMLKVNSRYVLIEYENGEMRIKNFLK